MKRIFLNIVLFLVACAPASPSGAPQVVSVYATSAAQPWLAELYNCQKSVLVRRADSSSDADIVLRLGQPANLSTPAFQVAMDDVLVVVNRAQPFKSLNAEQVRGLFTGQVDDWSQVDPSKTGKVRVWVFAQGSDVQDVFTKTMSGSPIVSTARLATSPNEMSRAIAGDENAVGILSRHWKTDNIMDVYLAASVPVLAITPSEPQAGIKDLLACLQREA